MSDWRERAEVSSDVVFFRYATDTLERDAREVYVWDLDKTYLDTTFETLKGIFRTALEKAFQKRNVPGTATLVRALRNSWQSTRSGKNDFPIYFITASPPQLENKIHQKLNLDGIYPFGVFFKDNLQNLRPSRFWRLTKQVGFKIQALLQMRLHLGDRVRQVLWGDDSESDAIIYSLYSDICARRLSEKEIRQVLNAHFVTGEQVETILELALKIPEQDPVEKIYINLADDTDSEYYVKFGRRTVPSYDSFQTALDLFQDKRLTEEQVILVAHDMIQNYGVTREELQASLSDLVRRNILGAPAVDALFEPLKERGVFLKNFALSERPKAIATQIGDRVFELEGNYDPWVPDRIDYLHDYR